MSINNYKYKTYTCDICYEELCERSRDGHRYGQGEGEFPIIIGGKQLQLSGFREFLHNKPVVICKLCQNEIREKVNKARKKFKLTLGKEK